MAETPDTTTVKEDCEICVWHDIPGEEPLPATTTITVDNIGGQFGPDHKPTVNLAVCEGCLNGEIGAADKES